MAARAAGVVAGSERRPAAARGLPSPVRSGCCSCRRAGRECTGRTIPHADSRRGRGRCAGQRLTDRCRSAGCRRWHTRRPGRRPSARRSPVSARSALAGHAPAVGAFAALSWGASSGPRTARGSALATWRPARGCTGCTGSSCRSASACPRRTRWPASRSGTWCSGSPCLPGPGGRGSGSAPRACTRESSRRPRSEDRSASIARHRTPCRTSGRFGSRPLSASRRGGTGSTDAAIRTACRTQGTGLRDWTPWTWAQPTGYTHVTV